MWAYRDIAEKRISQLKQQEKIDSELQSLECPSVVSAYLLHQRAKNRELTLQYKDTPFYSLPSVASKQLKETQNDLEELAKIIVATSPCLRLSKYLLGNRGQTEI